MALLAFESSAAALFHDPWWCGFAADGSLQRNELRKMALTNPGKRDIITLQLVSTKLHKG